MSYLCISENLNQVAVADYGFDPSTIQNPHYQEYLALSQKKFMFSDLLMMAKHATMLKSNQHKLQVLNLLKNLYEVASEALEAFYVHRLVHQFDAHVGEASCQLRAIKLAMMLKDVDLKQSTNALSQSLVCQRKAGKINMLISMYDNARKKIDGNMPLSHFIEQYQLDLPISHNEIFLITCFFLCKYKKVLSINRDIINLRQIAADWGISNSISEKLTKHMQRLASFFSVKIMLDADFEETSYQILLACLLQRDEVNRWVLPTIETSKYMLDYIVLHNLPISLHVSIFSSSDKKMRSYTYVYDQKNYYFKEAYGRDQFNISNAPPVFTIHGMAVSSKVNQNSEILRQYLKKYNLGALVLSSLSTHAQYPGNKLRKVVQDPYSLAKNSLDNIYLESLNRELRDNQANAMLYGFCNLYPHMLTITHVLCERLDLI